MRITKSHLRKIIKEEIKKTLSEDWEEELRALQAQQRQSDTDTDTNTPAPSAEELKQELEADLGAEAEVDADELWVRLPSVNDPERMSKNGLATRDRLNSKLIHSGWHADIFDKKGWVKVTKISEPRDTWTDPDPHGRYVPGEKAPRLSPWEE
jgi:hypothetical protein